MYKKDKPKRVPLFVNVCPETKERVGRISKARGVTNGIIVDEAVSLQAGSEIHQGPNTAKLRAYNVELRKLNRKISTELNK
jgi:hypothetical protein